MAHLHVAWQAWIQDVLQLYGQLLVSLGSSEFVCTALKIASQQSEGRLSTGDQLPATQQAVPVNNGKTSVMNASRKAVTLKACPADQLWNCVCC